MRRNAHKPLIAHPFIVAVLLTAAAFPPPLAGHEIPNDVTIRTLVKPEGQRLRLIVRAPLQAMRDVTVPLRTSQFVDLAKLDALLPDLATLWLGDNIDVFENDTKLPYPRLLAARASLPSDDSFRSYDRALAHVTGPRLPDETDLVWNQGLLDVLFDHPIQSDRSKFSINPKFARLGVHTITTVQFMPPGGAVRAFEFSADPGLVRLDPHWSQAASR